MICNKALILNQNCDINTLKIIKGHGKMNKMIKADIYFDGEYYCGKCIDFDIFTQGKTLDELTKNLKEAIKLHFETGGFYEPTINSYY